MMYLRQLLVCALFLSTLIARSASAQGSSADVSARSLRTEFTCQASISAYPSGTKKLALWIPLPSNSEWQQVEAMSVAGAPDYKINEEPRYHNRMVYVRIDTPHDPILVTVRFRVNRKEMKIFASRPPAKVDKPAQSFLQANTMAERSLPTGGRFLEISNQVTAGKRTTLEKARALYDHVLSTMNYDYKSESPKLGEGDSEFVCDYKRGDCTDIHSYLISLARSQKIPTIHEYGFGVTGIPVANPLPNQAKITSYHCYARFYDPAYGWIPMDASDGIRWQDRKETALSEFHFGNVLLERNAVVMSQGRNLVLAPPQRGAPVNKFIYPYAEADGKSVTVSLDLSRTLLDMPVTNAIPQGNPVPGRR